MRVDASTTDFLMFGDLLAHLRQHGFTIGVDHYLRMQQLLDSLGGRCAPRQLRTVLCPIFATNKAQQEQFYRAFDAYFDLFHVLEEPEETEESYADAVETRTGYVSATSNQRRWLYAAAPIGLVALVFALLFFFRTKPNEPAANRSQAETAAATPVDAAGDESRSTSRSTSEDVQVAVQDDGANSIPVSTPPAGPKPGFYERNRTGIELAVILSPLAFFLLYEWYRFARRKLLLQRQQTRKPPFVWPVRVDPPEEGLYDSEQFLTAARLLRRRQIDEFRRLDVEATISATIEHLGFPEFRYRSDSRVPEYLILIDRASYKDHQARLFEELTLALEREGVFVVRYFFDADPRVCRDERGAGVVQLTELQNKYAEHRLLVFSTGEKLLDQITGRLDQWTTIFNHWQDRALLTVESTSSWGLREIALAQLFIVLPASLNGLLALVDYFETTVPEDLRAWLRVGEERVAYEKTPDEIVRGLRGTLGEDTFEWLCACAVYTELQWNLTLFIGCLPSMPPGIVTETNLLRLIRVPWFRSGVIPDEVRWLLINELAPAQQKAIRSALIELLEKDPAPAETFAGDQYSLNLSVQRWLQSRSRKRLLELMQTLKRVPRNHVVRDLTLIRFLESASRSPLDFLLPNRLRRLFYHRGVPAFGMKTGARFLLALFLIGIAWMGTRALSPSQRLSMPDALAKNLGDPKDLQPAPPSNDQPTPNPAQARPDSSAQQSAPAAPELTTTPSTRGPRVETPARTPRLPSVGILIPTVPPVSAPILTVPPSDAGNPEIFGDPPPRREPTTSTAQTGPGVAGNPSVGTGQGSSGTPDAEDGKADTGDANRVFNSKEVSKKAKLTSNPVPLMTEEARKNQVSGVVRLRVLLSANGTVTEVVVLKALPYGLTEQAMAAARRIKFIPAQKDGKPVSQYQLIDYDFNVQPPTDLQPTDPRMRTRDPGRQPNPPRGRP